MKTPKLMFAKYAGFCKSCHNRIGVGESIAFFPATPGQGKSTVMHDACYSKTVQKVFIPLGADIDNPELTEEDAEARLRREEAEFDAMIAAADIADQDRADAHNAWQMDETYEQNVFESAISANDCPF